MKVISRQSVRNKDFFVRWGEGTGGSPRRITNCVIDVRRQIWRLGKGENFAVQRVVAVRGAR